MMGRAGLSRRRLTGKDWLKSAHRATPLPPNEDSLAGSPVGSENFPKKFSGVKNAKETDYV